MSLPVFVFDPTEKDSLSKVRGVGRYLQIFRENFPDWTFTGNFEEIPKDSVFINPFFNFLQPQNPQRVSNFQVAVIHDLIPLKYPRHFPAGIRGTLMVRANKKHLKNYDLFVTDSNASKNDIVEKLLVDERKVKVAYPTLLKIFSKSKFPKYETPNTEYCIYVGDATWNKNLVNIAKAIKQADVTCVFVGRAFQEAKTSVFYDLRGAQRSEHAHGVKKGMSSIHPWQKELYEFLELSHGDPRFIFPGFVSDEDLISLYRNAVANILVSRDEGFGFSYVEAASQKIPSVLSDIPVLKEISDDAALFCDPENPKDIAEKISRMFSDKDIRNTLAQESKERSSFFSPARFKDGIYSAIRDF